MEFRFAYPLMLLLLLAPLGIAYLMIMRQWNPSGELMTYSDTRLMSSLKSGWRVRFRLVPDFLQLIGLSVLVIALARPQTGNAVEIFRGQGIDVVLALDISGSMAALDFESDNRLDAAKAVIGDFVLQREFDRLGMVVFARNAYHHIPLTLDYAAYLHLLDRVQLVTDLQRRDQRVLDGTAIGLGIAASANMLRSGTAPSRVIVLLTDGSNNAGIDPLLAAEAAAALGIRIYTIGMGSPGMMRIPDRQGGVITVESDVDEDALQRIAEIGEGLYFRAEDTSGLQQIYDRINILERSDVERRVVVRWRDYAGRLLVIALGVLLLERLLRWTVFHTFP